jgi:hypothetical protein
VSSRFFRKLPGTRLTPAGLEWRMLRRLPLVLLVGTLLPGLVALGARWIGHGGPVGESAKHLQTLDAILIGVVVFHWTAVLTVAIACFIVMVMKGPGYVADAYPLSDSDEE